jgi:redox-sensitive bicupin YhaK (pirin superfamily)
MDPAFAHHPDLPVVEQGGYTTTLLVGDAFGERSSVVVHTPLLGIDLAATGAADTTVPLAPGFEHGVLVLEGECAVDGERLAPGTLLYVAPGRESLRLQSSAPTRALLIGGEPFREPIIVWWNFVARSHEELVRATQDWNQGARFGDVHGYDGPRLSAPDVSTLKLRA